MSCAVKSLASGTGSLDTLPVEAQCWGRSTSVCKVDADVTKSMQAARSAAHGYFVDMGELNAKLVLETLRKKEKGLLAYDESFSVELLALQQMVERDGQTRLQDAIMHFMPERDDPDDASAVLVKAQRVQTTPLYRAMPQSAQSFCRYVCGDSQRPCCKPMP